MPSVQAKTVLPFIEQTTERGGTVYTDEFRVYDKLSDRGYDHWRILHNAGVFVVGNIHTNTI